jgi:hypothetical protein
MSAVVCAALVASHWILDALTHQPDLPLIPGSSARIGLGLWNYPALAISIELLVFAGGVVLYLHTTRASNRVGTVGLWSLIVFLVVVYGGNVLGPPPPSVEAIAWTGHAQWLLVAWGYWVDRHRELRSP